MGWKGMAAGAWIGSLFGGSLGALLGAVAGNAIEKNVFSKSGGESRFRGIPPERRSMVFAASAAAILAKMAKADGVVTADEIAAVERAFAKLGFARETRTYAIGVFRQAKDDAHTIFEYAAEFAAAVESVEVREIFYGLLWELACADGTVSPAELQILQRMPQSLRIRAAWFELYRSEILGSAGGSDRRSQSAQSSRDSLAETYATLGVSPSASDEEVKRAYRDQAKRNHPDLLRAQGLPEELIGRATEKMSLVNAAWERVKKERGL